MTVGAEFEFAGTSRFEIKRKLGAGGMGVVYEAFDRDKDARVALKTLRDMNAQALYRLKKQFLYVPQRYQYIARWHPVSRGHLSRR